MNIISLWISWYLTWTGIKVYDQGTGHAFTRGWSGYSWNRELIPDPAGLIREFKDKDVYVVLNEHPHDGLRPEDDAYPAFARALGASYTSEEFLYLMPEILST